MNMSNFLIFGVFSNNFYIKVLHVNKAGFHRSWLIYIRCLCSRFATWLVQIESTQLEP